MGGLAAWPAPTAIDSGAPIGVRPYAIAEFRAMASPCRIIADNEELARAGEQFVHDLEGRWSRFLPSSEVSSVNGAGGHLVVVSEPTARLFDRAEFARAATAGRFNPLVLDRLEELGYGPSMASSVGASARVSDSHAIANQPIEVLMEVSGVRLPPGSRFDPGGIGKGLAGDLALEHMRSLGATTVQIELGGDVRLWGANWTGGRWMVDVLDPRDRIGLLTRLELAEGAIATSSVLGHTWTVDDRQLHHLIDPSTGHPSDTDVLSVTTTSSELWWAEVVAKVAVLAGSHRAPAVMRQYGCSGVVLDRAGTLTSVVADQHDALTPEAQR
jgi:thiamine biosynthesis lipoprotein